MPDKPFPRDEAGIEAMLDLFSAVLPGLQALLGLSAGDMVRLENARANFHYIRDIRNQIDAVNDFFGDWKDAMFKGPESPTIEIPVYPVITLPELAEQGIIPFLKYLIKKIKAAADYNESIGEQLDLVTNEPAPFNPEEIIPTLTLKALNDGSIEIKFSKQGLSAIRVDWRAKGESNWLLAGTYLTSPGNHMYPSPENKPEAREYRAVLLKNNEPVSQFSAIYSVVTTP